MTNTYTDTQVADTPIIIQPRDNYNSRSMGAPGITKPEIIREINRTIIETSWLQFLTSVETCRDDRNQMRDKELERVKAELKSAKPKTLKKPKKRKLRLIIKLK